MLERNQGLPLYLQLKKELIKKIRKGEYQPGNPIPTEKELCIEYGISRYPARQAMEELVSEGYLTRTRGRGTFVSSRLPDFAQAGYKKLLGIVMNSFTNGLCGQIFNGVEKQARARGYLTVVCKRNETPEDELNCIDMLMAVNVAGILVFPCDESRIRDKLDELRAKGIYLGLLDRNPGLSDIDYTGSDNTGGAYTAVRHLSFQGYKNIAFASDSSNASSVDERLDGYLKAVDDLNMSPVMQINTNRLHLREELAEFKKYLPLGIFAINDGVAFQCMDILRSEGINIGKEVGIVGFDNTLECKYSPVPLTSVAQNGLLIGQSAVDIALDKIEGKTDMVFRSIIPTQLVVRNSCGEKG